MKAQPEQSELVQAAMGLDAELQRFRELTDSLRGAPLDSQKKIQRAAKMFSELADTETSLNQQVAVLVAAVSRAREEQQAQATSMNALAESFAKRTASLQQLLIEYGTLGEQAARLNAQMQEIGDVTDGAGFDRLTTALGLLEALAERATLLTHECTAQDFTDVGRLVDAMGQGLTAMRKKLERFQRALPGSLPQPHEDRLS